MTINRTFILGDEWLYYKIYCGKRTADGVLTDVLKPLTEDLLRENVIDQWFFIRYSDPKPHLRVRFRIKEISYLNIVIQKFKTAILPYIDNELVWCVQTDTYQRELERYGVHTILEAERFFNIDSTICLNALTLIEDDNLLFLFALRYIDTILNAFNFNLDTKIHFTKHNFNLFKTEFNADKHLNKQLNVKYQNLRPSITAFMTNPQEDYRVLIDFLSSKEPSLNAIAITVITGLKKEQISLDDILASYIHMMVNRLFRDKQRIYELVCYSSLCRFYNLKKYSNV